MTLKFQWILPKGPIAFLGQEGETKGMKGANLPVFKEMYRDTYRIVNSVSRYIS